MKKNKIEKIDPRKVVRTKQLVGSVTVVVGLFTSVFLTAYYMQNKDAPTVDINDFEKKNTPTTVDFDVEVVDNDDTQATITAVDLYQGATLVQSVESFDKLSFSNLLNDNVYHIEVTYTYDKKDGTGIHTEKVVGEDFHTIALTAPTVSFDNVQSTQTDVTFNVLFNQGTSKNAKITSIDLMRNGSKFDSITNIEDLTNLSFSFDGLYSGSEYSIILNYSYDLNDGNGVHTQSITSTFFSTKEKHEPKVVLDNVLNTENQVTFDYMLKDEYTTDAKIESIDLYHIVGETKEKVQSLSSFDANKTLSFDKLLNNNSYYISLTYSYNLNDEQGLVTKELRSNVFTTRELIVPSASIINVKDNETSISFDLSSQENDNEKSTNLKLVSVDLLHNGKVEQTISDLENKTADDFIFSDLLNNNSYFLRLNYTYDLNDGRGALDYSYTTPTKTTTRSLALPNVATSITNTTTSSFKVSSTLSNNETDAKITKVAIFNTDDLTKEVAYFENNTDNNELFEVEFTGLNSNNTYKVITYYTYDLNDGSGITTPAKEYEKEITTLAKASPEVEAIVSVTSNETQINVDLTKIDLDETSLKIDYIKIFQEAVRDAEGNIIREEKIIYEKNDEEELSFSFDGTDGILNNNNYLVYIEYSYDLNDKKGTQKATYTSAPARTDAVNDTKSTFALNDAQTTSTSLTATLSFASHGNPYPTNGKVVLYDKDGNEIASQGATLSEGEQDFTFDNLYSEATYTMVFTYDYHFNDGQTYNGNEYKTITRAITGTTNAKERASVEFNTPVTKDNTTISFSLKKSENADFNNLQISSIVLKHIDTNEEIVYDGEITFTDLVSNTITFDNLLNANTYQVIINYKYSLNRYEGDISPTIQLVSDNQLLDSLTAPTLTWGTCEIENVNTLKYQATLSSNTSKNAYITSVEIYKEGENTAFRTKSYEEGTTYVSDSFEDLDFDANYILKINYTYDLNDSANEVAKKHYETVTNEASFNIAKLTAPTLEFSTLNVTNNQVSFNIIKINPSSLEYKDLVLYLYDTKDTEHPVKTIVNPDLTNTITISELDNGHILYNNHSYYVYVTYKYDVKDGKGDQDASIISNNFNIVAKTAPTISFEAVSTTVDTVSFSIHKNDETSSFKELVSIALKDKDGNTVSYNFTGAISFDETLTFSGIKSNTNYTLEFTYSYDLNDGSEIKQNTISTSFTTKAKTVPTVNINTPTTTPNSISFTITATNLDNNLTLKSATIVNTSDSSDTQTISLTNADIGLTKSFNTGDHYNTEYTLTLNYEYDLNDGGDAVQAKVEKVVTTEDKATSINQTVSTTKDSVKVAYTIDSDDQVETQVESIALYLGDSCIESRTGTLSGTEETFANLLSNTEYKVVITYSYKNNNGERENATLVSAPTTGENAVPTVIASNFTTTSTSVNFENLVTNTDNVALTINKVNLYIDGEEEPFKTLTSFDELTFNGLLSNKTYYMTVEYTYNLNDGNGNINDTSSASQKFSTPSKATPVVKINDLSANGTTVSYSLSLTDLGNTNATITKIEIYNKNGNTYVNEISGSQIVLDQTLTFSSLLNGNEYYLVVYYSYNPNEDKAQTIVSTKYEDGNSVKTISLNAPSFDFGTNNNLKDSEVLSTTFTFDAKTSLNANVTKIEILKDNAVINTIYTPSTSVSFDNLLSNTSYTIKATYEYDLNDGKGIQTSSKEITLKTKEKDAVSVSVDSLTLDGSTLSFTLDVTNNDNANYKIDSVSLYKSTDKTNAFKTITNKDSWDNLSFTDLENGYTYFMIVEYHYDSNDVEGGKQIYLSSLPSKYVQVKALTAPEYKVTATTTTTSFTYNVANVGGTDSEAKVTNITIKDPSGIILVNKDNPTELTGTLEDLYSGSNYEVSVTYTYNLNDGNGLITKTEISTITTVSKTAPKVSITPTAPTVYTDTSIKFTIAKYNSLETDATLNITSIKLVPTDTTLETFVFDMNNFAYDTVLSFDGLLNGVEYQIVIDGTYDFNNLSADSLHTYHEESSKVSTGAKSAPTITIENKNVTIGSDSIEFNTTTTDSYNTNPTITSIVLKDGSTTVKTLTATDTRIFEDLKSEHAYTIIVNYTYNLNDGKGERTASSTSVTFTTKAKQDPVAAVTKVTKEGEEENSMTFKVVIDEKGNDVTITGIKVINKDGSTAQTITSWPSDSLNFELTVNNLNYSNEYALYVEYSIDKNNDKAPTTAHVQSAFVGTTDLTPPTVTFDNIVANKEGVTFNASIVDNDSTQGKITSIDLYKDGIKVSSITNPTETSLSFSKLLSNNTYKIVLTYTYDLHDGSNELVTKTIEKVFTTVAKEKATFEVINESIATDGTTFNYGIGTISNADNCKITLVKVEAITADGKVTKTITADSLPSSYEELSVSDLYNNQNYHLKVTYSVDYNDGEYHETYIESDTLPTKVNVAPKVTNITFDNNEGLGLEGTIIVTYTDVDSTGITKSIGLKTSKDAETYVDTKTNITVDENGQVTVIFTGLRNNTTYYADFYGTYDLNDSNGEKSYSVSCGSITTPVLTAPTVEVKNTTSLTAEGKLDGLTYNYEVYLTNPNNVDYRITSVDLISNTNSKNNQTYSFNTETDFSTSDTQKTLSFALVNGNEYYVVVNYEYNLNDENGETWVQATASTTALSTVSLEAPTVTISAVYDNGTGATISVKSSEKTSEKVAATITSIQQVIAGTTNAKDISFTASNDISTSTTSLLNDNTYEFVVNYTYDLNDGFGTRNGQSKTTSIKTTAIATPTIEFSGLVEENANLTDTFSIKNTSLDANVEITSIIVKNANGAKVSNITFSNDNFDSEGNLSNLTYTAPLNNSTYTIEVNYTYNLNNAYDENGDVAVYEGKATYTFTTLAKTAPTAKFTSATLDADTLDINFGISITDTTDTGAKLTSAELYYVDDEGDVLYRSLDNLTNITNLSFTNVLNGRTYYIIAEVTYNLHDGSKDQKVTIDSRDVSSIELVSASLNKPVISFGATGATKTTVNTSLTKTDDDSTLVKINSIDLYVVENGVGTKVTGKSIQNIDQDNLASLSLAGLYNDTEYYLVANYTYNLNDGRGDIAASDVVSSHFKTVALTAPTVTISTPEAKTEIITTDGKETTNTYVEVAVSVKDDDGTGAIIYSIDLQHLDADGNVKDVTTLSKWDSLSSIRFDGLLNDNTYKIVVNYRYSLNDGRETIEEYNAGHKVDTINFTTPKLNEPTLEVSVDDIIATGTDITAKYSITDSDITITSRQAVLKNIDTGKTVEIKELSSADNEVVFKNIDSMTTYQVEIVVNYDLNDGTTTNNSKTASSTTVTTRTVKKDLSYEVDETNKTLTITNYKGSSNEVSLYEEYDIDGVKYKVVSLDNAFANKTDITSITLPKTITTLKNNAFSNCTALTTVNYEGTIDDWANISIEGSKLSNPMTYASTFNQYVNDVFVEVTSIELSSDISTVGNYQFAGFNHVTSLSLPSTITSIGESAFEGCSALTAVEIPSNVSTISKSAFANCSKVASLTLNEQLTTIAESTFANNTSLTTLTIPTNIKTIEKGAFSNASSLTSLTLNEGLETIGESAFAGASSLTDLVLPNSLTTLSTKSFANNTSLTSVEFGESLTSSATNTFAGCSSLTNITIPNVVSSAIATAVTDINGHITNLYFEGTMTDWLTLNFENYKDNLIQYTTNFYVKTLENETELINKAVVPSDITSINSNAFYGYKGLTDVDLTNVTGSIGSNAFYGTSLTKLVLTDSIKSIDANAFGNCSKLTYVDYGKSLTTISSLAFNKSTSIKDVVIPNQVSLTIADSIKSIPSVENIYFEGTMKDWLSLSYTSSAQNPIQYAKNFYVYETSESSFPDLLVTDAIVPNEITSIGQYAFYGYKGLKAIHLNNIEALGTDAFYKCTNLQDVYYDGTVSLDWCKVDIANKYADPMAYSHNFHTKNKDTYELVKEVIVDDSIKELNNYTFLNFSTLENITLPASLVASHTEVFEGCTSLTNTYYLGTIEQWANIDFDQLKSNPMWHATNFYLVEEIENKKVTEIDFTQFDSSFTGIKNYSFYNFDDLAKVTIPNTITSSGKQAFENCSTLVDVYYEGTLQDWANINFATLTSTPMMGSESSKLYVKTETGYKEITSISDLGTLSSVGNYQFAGFGNVTTLSLPTTVTEIGGYAFYNCSKLEALNTTNIVTIGDYAFANNKLLSELTFTGTVTTLGNNVFEGDTSLTSLIFGDDVITIGDNAFSKCTSLESVTFDSHLTSIGNSAFSECSNIKEIVIPNSVTTIGDKAFTECGNLTSVTIGNGVLTIGNSAFENDTNISTLVLGSSINTIGDFAFRGASQVTEITLPDTLTTIGKGAFDGLGLTTLVIPNNVTTIKENAFSNNTKLTTVDLGEHISTMTNAFTNDTLLTTFYIVPKRNDLISTALGDKDSKIIYLKGTIDQYVANDWTTDNAFASYASKLYALDANNEYYEVINVELSTATSIGGYAFASYDQLESISLGSVTSIDEHAFENCTKITTLDLTKVESAGRNAFANMTNLETIRLSNSLTSYEDAFTGVTSIKNIYIDDTTISSSLSSLIKELSKSNSIENIYFAGTLEDWLSIEFTSESQNVMQYASNFYLGKTLLTEVNVPTTVTKINDYAFYGNKKISSVTLNNVTTIGNNAFNGCENLISLDLSKVETIGDHAFSSTTLKEITLSGANTDVSLLAFDTVSTITTVNINKTINSSTTSLINSFGSVTKVNYLGTINDWLTLEFTSAKENPFSLESAKITLLDEYGNETSITELDLSKYSVTTISSYAFYNCSTLTTLKVPSTITSIGKDAFTGCTALKTVTLSTSFNSQGIVYLAANSAKNGNTYDIYYEGTLIDWIKNSFTQSNETPASFASSFYIVVDGKYQQITTLDLRNYANSTINPYTFYGISSIKTIILPNNITLGNYAFFGITADVYYMGTSAEWSTATKDMSVDAKQNLTAYFYSEEEPTSSKESYFFFNDSGEIVKWSTVESTTTQDNTSSL